MREWLFVTVALLMIPGISSAAEKVQSDCGAAELRALRSQTILGEMASGAKLVNMDCTVLRGEKDAEKLLVLYVINNQDEVQTYVELFSRHGLNAKSHPHFRSDVIGSDSFTMLALGKHRLLFVLPQAGAKTVQFYTCTQTSSGEIHFSRRDLNLGEKMLSESSDHQWTLAPGKQPKILKEKNQWRAILSGKIVDL